MNTDNNIKLKFILDCMTLWPNGYSSRLLTDGLLVQNQGETLKSRINGTPFQVEFSITDNIFVSISKIASIFLFCLKLAK